MSMRFSVITPSLNQGAYLEQCLSSVREACEHAGGPVEHIVMDGGSTDHSRDLLAKQDFARWQSEPDRGQADAINKGLAQATGEILCYLCADDLFEPGALGEVDAAFRANPGVDVVYGDCYFLEADSGWKRLKPAGPYSVERLRRTNFLRQPAVFWKRGVYERFGPFDQTLHFCLDHEYWLRLAGKTEWLYLPEPLATARLHADAKTSSQLSRAWDEAAAMQQRYGIVGRPSFEAFWMRTLGHHYYRAKRLIFRYLGRLKS